MKQIVAYLGPQGTYSELAAHQFFGKSAEYVPYDSFEAIVESIEHGAAACGVLPVENSIEGSVTRTLDLLIPTKLQIMAEVALPIHHQLLTHATALEDITEVTAHPQALAQCRKWLDAHLPQARRIPAASNAEAARSTHGFMHQHRAAIAGKHAAEIYHLPILRENIEDEPTNATRFVVLGAHTTAATGADRTSIACSIPNRPGSLHQLLGIFAKHNVNLSRLESRPLPEALWEYLFYIDCDGHSCDAALGAAIKEAHQYATFFKVLGSYPRAQEKP